MFAGRSKVQWGHRDIDYSELRQEIAAISAMQPPAIVDVSAVKKIYLGDLIATGLIEGMNLLCTFDQNEKPDHDRPWTMLFHDVIRTDSSEAKYQYVNLLGTRLFQECSKSILIKKPRLRISLGSALALFIFTLIIYFVIGPSSILVQTTFLLSSFASILSLFYIFYPLRR